MTDDKDKPLTSQLLSWAAGQPFNNVLLMAILGAIAWAFWYGVTAAIPSHLKKIQTGYESIDATHIEEQKRLTETYDKWLDRIGHNHNTGTAGVGDR